MPAVVQGDQVKNATEYQLILERKLPVTLDALAKAYGVRINYFDHIAFSNNLRATSASAGLKDLDSPCQATYPKVKPVCENPDTHYYWDEWHPTRKVHALAAKAMLQPWTLTAEAYPSVRGWLEKVGGLFNASCFRLLSSEKTDTVRR